MLDPGMIHHYSAFHDGEVDAVLPAATAVPAAPVQTSRFLALPQEIRDEIYGHVFAATRLTMGRRVSCASASAEGTASETHGSGSGSGSGPASGAVEVTRLRPARHSLALFRVCRQITAELRSDEAWLGQVLFNFEDVATMLDVLGAGLATPARRARVREVRVRAGGLVRSTPHRGSCGFRLGGLMRLLPGLRLDRLTVLPALPCRVHGQHCPSHHHESSSSALGVWQPGAADLLGELLRCGRGWRELCFLHPDAGLLTADRRRPGSLEAMMLSMGFWDADADAYDDVFAPAERLWSLSLHPHPHPHQRRHQHHRHQHHRRRLGSFLASYADKKELRLPQWRAILAERDGRPDDVDSVDNVDNGKTDTPRSTIHAYGVRDGLAMRRVETLGDVHASRLRGEEFMVVVQRDPRAADDWMAAASAQDVDPYLFPDGDPRTLGYGTTWDALRSFLFPWDYVQETRCRRDRYVHRDEYIMGSAPWPAKGKMCP